MIQFDQKYYDSLIGHYGYDSFDFWLFDYSLNDMSKEELEIQYLCHYQWDIFAQKTKQGLPGIITTGFWMSGPPHVWTLSQIMRIIRLRNAGIPTQIVLWDLDAYNGKNKNLAYVADMSQRYTQFINRLGYLNDDISVLRNQYNDHESLLTAYLAGKFMDDNLFNEAEEDLHWFYQKKGKIDDTMTYRRKLSLALMTWDFLNLWRKYGAVNVLLWIDEHKYVLFAQKILKKIQDSNEFDFLDEFHLSATYTRLMKWFNNYPKQSKSFEDSSINAESSENDIINKIMNCQGSCSRPEENIVFQMMVWIWGYSLSEIDSIYHNCQSWDVNWDTDRKFFSERLITLFQKW